jgi:uncharacterized protein YjlB
MAQAQVQTYTFQDDGSIPNNPTLPLLVYPGALTDQDASSCRKHFEAYGWSNTWVNGVYNYHHYHSITHEVLGIVRGAASIQFGGEIGDVVHVRAGDVVVIPAGVGHCNRGETEDFQVVGAYPNGMDWDLCTGQPNERPQVIENIRRVPMPETDPVYGADGPLLKLWEV